MPDASVISFIALVLCGLIVPIMTRLGAHLQDLRLARWKQGRDVAIPTIPKSIQDEIDQTPEWWDREFRKLSGEPEPRQWGIQTADALSAIEKMYSPRAWADEPRYWVGSDLFIGGPGPGMSRPFDLYCPKEGDSYRILPSRPERMMKFLSAYDLDAKEIAEDGWNSLGYWFLTDEWEYSDVRTFAQAESVLEPTYRVREWREWPEGFDYEGMVKAWNGH